MGPGPFPQGCCADLMFRECDLLALGADVSVCCSLRISDIQCVEDSDGPVGKSRSIQRDLDLYFNIRYICRKCFFCGDCYVICIFQRRSCLCVHQFGAEKIFLSDLQVDHAHCIPDHGVLPGDPQAGAGVRADCAGLSDLCLLIFNCHSHGWFTSYPAILPNGDLPDLSVESVSGKPFCFKDTVSAGGQIWESDLPVFIGDKILGGCRRLDDAADFCEVFAGRAVGLCSGLFR